MRQTLNLTLLFFTLAIAQAQPTQHIWLIGNTADIPPGSPYWGQLRQELEQASKPIYLLIAGDIIPDCDGKKPPEAPIQAILELARGLEGVQLGLLPGDRDWADSGADGWDCIRDMEKYVHQHAPKNVDWLIDKGCPGPEIVEIGDNILLLALNTQWWNHPHRKPIPADAVCDEIVEAAIHEEIEDAIKENQERNLIITGHFPPYSLGKYGGFFPLSTHLLPPVAGGIYAAYHENIGGPRDITNERSEKLSDYLLGLAREYENIVFLSGHEANQQILSYYGSSLVNSGAPTAASHVAHNKLARLARAQPGLIQLHYEANGAIQYTFLRYTGDGFTGDDTGALYQSPCQPDGSDIPVNQVKVPCLAMDQQENTAAPNQPDSIRTAAGAHYAAGALHRLFFGPHYRTSWAAPVMAPVLRLDTAYGGLEVLERGGGRQTISLKMQTEDGRQYVFRSVDKDPVSALSYTLRRTIAAAITRDQTSSQQPYGALAVAPMLQKLGILHASPHLYVMPDAPRLGQFRSTFANMLGMVEERPTNGGKGPLPFGNADQIYKSYDLFHEMYDRPNVHLDTREFARARMFDILIGDWSKHEDNWKWAGFKQPDGTLVRPIPRDRDHAFSNLDGLLPWLAERQWAVPNLEHFNYKIKSVRSLTYQARHMDRFLSIGLNREDWLQAAREVQQALPPEEIEKSIRQMPRESFELSGRVITAKLLQRRQDLETYADRFYRLLARYVDVPGTNKKEFFHVLRQPDGSSLVEIRQQKDSSLTYRRLFLPDETREIRLYGLHGDDRFLVEGQADKAIRLRLVGGAGEDEIVDRSEVKRGGKRTLVYEKNKDAIFDLGQEARLADSWNQELYYYDRTAFAYNTYFPIALFSFNTFNGLVLNGGVTFTRRNFNKRDFSAKHKFSFQVGTLNNFSLSYDGQARHILHKWDLLLHATWAQPDNFNYFFGIGNGISYNEDLFNDDYYLVRLNRLEGRIGLQRQFWKRSQATLTAGYSQNDVPDKANTILADSTGIFGVGELNIANAEAALEIDLRDHRVFPTRGYRLRAAQELGFIDSGQSYGVTDLFLEYFLSPRLFPLTLGLKAGYGNSFGDVPFYKLPQLGQNQGLRGFQRNRFAGNSRVYFNSELRIPLAKLETAVVPLDIGLIGFYDMGKIIQEMQVDEDWQLSYGGGFYLIPLSRSYTLSVLVGASREETAVISLALGTNF
ncbi:MAG: BamA/TamA family outer membrane protein [Phaeodactylibacter sp.]|nr:BamA/TamA family outer membrane protein [Phaeodactylibacter sp.]